MRFASGRFVPVEDDGDLSAQFERDPRVGILMYVTGEEELAGTEKVAPASASMILHNESGTAKVVEAECEPMLSRVEVHEAQKELLKDKRTYSKKQRYLRKLVFT